MKSKYTTQKIVYIAVLAAIVCVVTFFRFPFLGSKVHLANAMCLLSGLLIGLAFILGLGLIVLLFLLGAKL